MPNFFYFDANGQKFGPVNDNQLKSLAAQGIIVPQTPLETDTGHRGTAGQIPGLFAAPPQQQLYPQYQQQPPVISTGTYLWIIFMGYILDPHNKTIVDRMTSEQRAILFRWRLCVAGCCLLCLIILFLFFLICS